ncbi:MAG: hypothetical protein QNJ05_10550 [Woeseiaceae bacterium]|nr:hypothetical protein [Woeseiaceae bacterium]
MMGETGDTTEEVDDLDSDLESEEEIMGDDDDDNAEVMTAEINVEELVAKIDKQDGNELERKKAVKRRLDQIEEHRKEMEDLDSTYNFNLDDDL